MDRSALVGVLLAALDRQIVVAARFAGRRRINATDFMDEVRQESAVRILEGAGNRFDPILGTSDAYVAGIVYYVCIEILQTLYRQTVSIDGRELAGEDFDPAQIAIRREEIADAGAALLSMTPCDRHAIGNMGRSARPHSKGSGSRRSTPYVRVFRAKERFRGALIQVRASRVRRGA